MNRFHLRTKIKNHLLLSLVSSKNSQLNRKTKVILNLNPRQYKKHQKINLFKLVQSRNQEILS